MDIATIISGIAVVVGALFGGKSLWDLFKSKASPKTVDLVEDVLEALRIKSQEEQKALPQPAPQPVEPKTPSRVEALQQVESMLRFFEAQGNKAGAEALLIVAKELLSIKV